MLTKIIISILMPMRVPISRVNLKCKKSLSNIDRMGLRFLLNTKYKLENKKGI